MNLAGESKSDLRKKMRKIRREHARNLDPLTSALIFMRPPGAVLEMIPDDASIGLYLELPEEAPARRYARYFVETGRKIALPAFDEGTDLMHFREWTDPFGESDLEEGLHGPQPLEDNARFAPDILFVPLVAFTERGERMGQGGGCYDRWLESHSDTVTFGMAWDVQKVEALPLEPHDRLLDAIITPTRLYGPF